MLWSTPLSRIRRFLAIIAFIKLICNNRVMWYWSRQCASQRTVLGNSPLFEYSLKTKDRQFDNVVVTGGTVSCHNDNLWCQQWRQSCQIDDLLFSVFLWLPIANITLTHKLLEIHGWVISTAAVEALVILYNQSFNRRSADHSHMYF